MRGQREGGNERTYKSFAINKDIAFFFFFVKTSAAFKMKNLQLTLSPCCHSADTEVGKEKDGLCQMSYPGYLWVGYENKNGLSHSTVTWGQVVGLFFEQAGQCHIHCFKLLCWERGSDYVALVSVGLVVDLARFSELPVGYRLNCNASFSQ